MVGRTPEYLGKKIEAREMKLAMPLLTPALVLTFAAISVNLKTALDSLGNAGPHGFSEIIYAYASTAANNGSGRHHAGSIQQPASSCFWDALAASRQSWPSPARSPRREKRRRRWARFRRTDFVIVLIGVVLIVALLQFFPILALGPLAEHFMLARGKAF